MAKKSRKAPIPKFVQYLQFLISIPDVQKIMVAMTSLAEAKITLATVQTQLATKQLELSAALLPLRANIETNNTTCDLVLSERRLAKVRRGEKVPPLKKAKAFIQKGAKFSQAKNAFGAKKVAKKVTVSSDGSISLGKEKLGEVPSRTI
jgi:hypothetical protein